MAVGSILPNVSISDPNISNPEFYFPENTGTVMLLYIITLAVTTNNGCDSTITDSVTIHPTPLVLIDSSITLNSCGPFVINFNNLSNPYNGDTITNMTFQWLVDDTLQNSTINFTNTFNSGINTIEQYEVVLIGQTRCTNSDTITVTVYPDPIAIIDTSGSLIDCANLIMTAH